MRAALFRRVGSQKTRISSQPSASARRSRAYRLVLVRGERAFGFLQHPLKLLSAHAAGAQKQGLGARDQTEHRRLDAEGALPAIHDPSDFVAKIVRDVKGRGTAGLARKIC